MTVKLHSWSLTPEEAARIQTELRTRLVLSWDKRPVTTIGGVDVSIKTESTRAAIVVLSYPDLTPLEGVLATRPWSFLISPGCWHFERVPPSWPPGKNYRINLTCCFSMGKGSPTHAGSASPHTWDYGWSAPPSALQSLDYTDGMQKLD